MSKAGRILLVEDEDAVLFAFKKILSTPGIQVDTAASLPEATALLEDNQYDAVIADLRLSDATNIEGFDVIKLAKKNQKKCTIIVLTAYGRKDTIEHVFEIGADYYLEKPISPQKIKGMLQDLKILPTPP